METVKIALTQYGVGENIEKETHPQIAKYFESIGINLRNFSSQPSWSSAFVNWVAKKAGLQFSGKLEDKSWLSVGESTHYPSWGDIVVLWKDSPLSKEGYVGIFVKETRRYVYILGGDQRNKVCIKAYPKSRVLDYRKLKKAA